MPSKRKTTENHSPAELDFENALVKIELIVQSMEDGQLPLDQLVNQYDAASKLIKHCESLISSARERIELITLSNNQDTPLQPSPAPPSNDHNDITLF